MPLYSDPDISFSCLPPEQRGSEHLIWKVEAKERDAHHMLNTHNMSLVSVAIVSKDNKPLYLKGFRDISESDDSFPVDMFDLAREASNNMQSTPATSPVSDGAGAGAGGSTVPLDAKIGKTCSIDQQFVLHSALDRLEQLMEPNGLGAAWRYGRPNQLGHEAMFVGLIGHVDDLRLYAYITTTKIKIIVACEDAFLPGQADQGRAHDVALKNLMVSELVVMETGAHHTSDNHTSTCLILLNSLLMFLFIIDQNT